VLSHYAESLNDQGQIYLMPDCMTGLDTVTLNNAFEHAQYLEIMMPNGTRIFKNRTETEQ